MKARLAFERLSDIDLTIEVKRLVRVERGATAQLIACLAEFDARRLYLAAGFSSMFTYCRDHLHLGDGAAYRRIEAARASRRFPQILEMIGGGVITLTNLGLIARHLPEATHAELLADIAHQRKSDVELIVARLNPKPDVPTMIRRVPAANVARTSTARASVDTGFETLPVAPHNAEPEATALPAAKPIVAPLAPERFKLQITMNQETHDRLRQLQNLMRHSIPNGDVGLIIDRALTCLLHELLRRKCGARKRDFNDDWRRPEEGGHRGLLH